MGRSYLQKTEVAELIASRLPATLLLMLAGDPVRTGARPDHGRRRGALAGQGGGPGADDDLLRHRLGPAIRGQLLLLYVFAVKLGWFPIGGYGTFAHLVLPAVTLGILGSGWYARMMRSSMIDVLRADFCPHRTRQGLDPRP
jgi:peptide/nickel transport system permease protein